MQSIMRELIHLHFLFNLIHVNRSVVQTGSEDYEQAATHQAEISRVCDKLGWLRVNAIEYPIDAGLAHEEGDAKARAIETFRSLLCKWEGAPIELSQPLKFGQEYPPPANHMHSVLANFYIRTAFHGLGRAPEVPHGMPWFNVD